MGEFKLGRPENITFTEMDNLVRNTKVKIKKLNEFAKEPLHGSDTAAGYDLYAATNAEIHIQPHKTVMVGTGLAFEIPVNTMLCLYARSGLANKKGLRPANCVGIVDSDYRGEVQIALHNDTDRVMTIEPQERIAQAILQPFYFMNIEEVKELSETKRGDKGFGSTGKK